MNGEDRIRHDIAHFGWHSVSVFPENEGQDRFTYTIGFSESYQAPEVAIFGLAGERAHQLLGVCAALLDEGESLEVEVPDDRLLQGGYKVMFKEMKKEAFSEYLGTAIRYFGHSDFRCLVMFFPDSKGRFPWEKGYDYIRADEGLKVVENLQGRC